jgi:hypothetical protein
MNPFLRWTAAAVGLAVIGFLVIPRSAPRGPWGSAGPVDSLGRPVRSRPEQPTIQARSTTLRTMPASTDSLDPGFWSSWWARLLPKTELEARIEDFQMMSNNPGNFPEFAELVAQLREAGVPERAIQIESREILGALLERHQFQTRATQIRSEPPPFDSEEMRRIGELMAQGYDEDVARASAELVTRLTALGLAMEGPTAQRILQLRPTAALHDLNLPGANAPSPWPAPASQPNSLFYP